MNSKIDISNIKLDAGISTNESNLSAEGIDTSVVLSSHINSDVTNIPTSLQSDSVTLKNTVDGTGTPIVTNNHEDLLGRYKDNQHPISAISGLESELLKLSNAINGASDSRVVDISNEYYRSTSSAKLEGGSWSSSSPGWSSGVYIWSRIKYTYESGIIKYSSPVCYTGSAGKTGSDGKTSYVHFAYANSSDGVKDFSTTNDGSIEYLYLGKYSDFNIETSIDPNKYSWSLIRGESGKGIKSSTPIYYCTDKYTEVNDSDGNVIIVPTLPSKPNYHVGKPENQYNAWTTDIPPWTNVFQYYFTSYETVYDDDTYEWADPVLNAALQIANKLASEAKTKVDDNSFIIQEIDDRMAIFENDLKKIESNNADDKSELSTKIEELRDEFDKLNDSFNKYVKNDTLKYISYDDSTGLLIGSNLGSDSESPYKIKLDDSSIDFIDGDKEIIKIQNGKCLMDSMEILNHLDIGNFRFNVKSDGGASLVWVDSEGGTS